MQLPLSDSAATERLGAALARGFRRAGARAGTLYLRGELGAGKTTCVRGLLRAFGVAGTIRSPTYTLLEVYAVQHLTCVHLDLYRLAGALEVEELGLRDYLDGTCLLMVEWPDKGGSSVPPGDLALTLEHVDGSRLAALRADTPAGEDWLLGVAAETGFASVRGRR